MKSGTHILLASLLLLALGSCKNEPIFPEEPQIEFVDIQPRIVKPWPEVDTITVTLRFQDGDGDLGNLNEDDQAAYLYLIDTRYKDGLFTKEQATYSFSLPNMTPNAKNPSIQGKISVEIYGTVLSSLGIQEENTSFEIELYDRAGNKATRIGSSNPDLSTPIFTDQITIRR